MSSTYNSDAIEVLTGLDPVRKRPGMYTDTTRPNHLLQEVVDNSVDEALAGFASNITLATEEIKTKTIAEWKQTKINIHKKPSIFLIG